MPEDARSCSGSPPGACEYQACSATRSGSRGSLGCCRWSRERRGRPRSPPGAAAPAPPMDPGRGARRRPGRGDVGGLPHRRRARRGPGRGRRGERIGQCHALPRVGARRPLERSRPDPSDGRQHEPRRGPLALRRDRRRPAPAVRRQHPATRRGAVPRLGGGRTRPPRLRAHRITDRVRRAVRRRAGADRGRGDRRGVALGPGRDLRRVGARRAAPVRDRRDRRDDRARGDRVMGERRGGRLATEPQFVRMPRNWGRQTSLFQWRQPAFWLYAVIVVVAALYTISQQQLFQKLSPSGWALSWGLLLLYGLPLFLAIYLLDLYEREPMSLVLGALVWGGVAA